MPDGSPQATVVWIDTDGEHVVFNTAEGRLKTENLKRNPRVAVAVFNAENPYQQLNVRGRVVEMTHDGAIDHINKLAKKYLGEDKYPYSQPGEVRVIYKIEARHTTSMS